MEKIDTKHLLGLENTSKSDIEKIIDVGFTFREVLDRPIKKVPILNGKNIVKRGAVVPESSSNNSF